MGLTLKNVRLVLLSLLILSLPYNMPSFVLGTISIILFVLIFVSKETDVTKIFREKELMILFGFILFTYLSIFWSTGEGLFDGDFKTNFGRFKYYFLLIPAIYFSKFSLKETRSLLYLSVLSPLGIIAVYYLNAFGITETYSYQIGGDNHFLSHYLVTSVFVLFSSTFLYIKIYESISQRSYKATLLYVIAFIFVSASLFIDERNEARLVNLAFLVMLIAVPMYFISNRLKMLVLLAAVTLIPLYVFNSDKLTTGYQRFDQAVEKDKYVGSWGHRTGYLIVGWKIFLEHPVFGRGINDISAEIKAFKKKDPKYFRGENLIRLHNGHLNFMVQIGLIGYLFLLYLFYRLFTIKIRDHTINTYKNMVLMLLLVLMMGEHYLSLRHTTNLFAILIAIWIVYRRLEHGPETGQTTG